jgi:hypothetical protein
LSQSDKMDRENRDSCRGPNPWHGMASLLLVVSIIPNSRQSCFEG